MRISTVKRLAAAFLFTQACLFASATINDADESLQTIYENEHFPEGRRLQRLSERAFSVGDYDTAVKHASEAIAAADKSDGLVLGQIKAYAASGRLDDALRRISKAEEEQVAVIFPDQFNEAKTYYGRGLSAKTDKNWDEVISNADQVVAVLANLQPPPPAKAEPPAPPPPPPPPPPAPAPEENVLPAQYTVGTWAETRDCFWNISERKWVYGDPRKWPVLYQANKQKLPDPDNPDLIKPGIVLDIPSIRGEKRAGMWEPGKVYTPK
jgi:tetratricopeptide (TPR) repeat protein